MTGDELKAARKRLELTQTQLATNLGYGKRQIVAYERGEAPIPPVVRLAMYALTDLAQFAEVPPV